MGLITSGARNIIVNCLDDFQAESLIVPDEDSMLPVVILNTVQTRQPSMV